MNDLDPTVMVSKKVAIDVAPNPSLVHEIFRFSAFRPPQQLSIGSSTFAGLESLDPFP